MIDPVNPLGGVPPTHLSSDQNHIMQSPRVQPIFWGSSYGSPSGLNAKGNFQRDYLEFLCRSSYFDLLAEYGVSRPTLLPSVWIADDGTTSLDTGWLTDEFADKLTDWLDAGFLPRPAADETNLLFLLFMPEMVAIQGVSENGKPVPGFHAPARYRFSPGPRSRYRPWFWPWDPWNLFYAALAFDSHDDTLNALVAHELVEAFTDRDGSGWKDDGNMQRELADLCPGPGIVGMGSKYRVSSLWSVSRGMCIQQEDLPPSDPDIRVNANRAFAYGVPIVYSVEAFDPYRNRAIHGSAAIYSHPGGKPHLSGQTFRVPGDSPPVVLHHPHGVLSAFIAFTPDDAQLWNGVEKSIPGELGG